MENSTFGQRNSVGGRLEIELRELTSGPDVLSANIPILATKTESEEVEVRVKGDT